MPSVDYISCPESAIRNIHSILTVVDGKVVYAEGPYAKLDTAPPAVIPAWSPVAVRLCPHRCVSFLDWISVLRLASFKNFCYCKVIYAFTQ